MKSLLNLRKPLLPVAKFYLQWLMALTVVSISFKPIGFAQNIKTIYGIDSRIELNEARNNSVQRWAPRVGALVERRFLTNRDHRQQASAPTLRDTYHLCDGERFMEQPSLSFCSGFLLAPNWLVTAGHCFEDLECKDVTVVFNYTQLRAPDFKFDIQEVLDCQEVIKSEKDDIAFIRIQASTLGSHFKLSEEPSFPEPEKKPRPFESLFILGFPSGLPFKVATGNILSSQSDLILASLDSFGGNSGSPVINARGDLIGMLLSGELDYVKDENRACFHAYHCDPLNTSCEGEDLLPSQRIEEAFKKLLDTETLD